MKIVTSDLCPVKKLYSIPHSATNLSCQSRSVVLACRANFVHYLQKYRRGVGRPEGSGTNPRISLRGKKRGQLFCHITARCEVTRAGFFALTSFLGTAPELNSINITSRL